MRDETLRRTTIELRAGELAALGFELLGTYDSPVAGAEGNREAFALLRRTVAGAAARRAPGRPLAPHRDPEPGAAMIEPRGARRVGVVAKATSADAAGVARELVEWLGRRGLEVLVEPGTARECGDGGRRAARSPARAATSSSCSAATARSCRWRARPPADRRSWA